MQLDILIDMKLYYLTKKILFILGGQENEIK